MQVGATRRDVRESPVQSRRQGGRISSLTGVLKQLGFVDLDPGRCFEGRSALWTIVALIVLLSRISLFKKNLQSISFREYRGRQQQTFANCCSVGDFEEQCFGAASDLSKEKERCCGGASRRALSPQLLGDEK